MKETLLKCVSIILKIANQNKKKRHYAILAMNDTLYYKPKQLMLAEDSYFCFLIMGI